jgi:hypothetical protein
VTWRASHPLGRVDVVSAPALRVAPGLSLAYRGPMPPQEAIFVNGDGPSALMLARPHADEMNFLEWMPTALPYALLQNPRVLIVGAGGGLDALQAMRLSRAPVTALESHPRVAGYVERRLRLLPVVAEARGFVRSTDQPFELIQVSLLESFGSASAGIYSLHENYLYTQEALGDYLTRLGPQGMLGITRWLKTPPRDEIRLFATAVRALEAAGTKQPARHLMFVRGLQTGTLLVSAAPFRDDQVRTARRFCEERLFDLDYFPGIRPAEANRFHRVADNLYYDTFQQILFANRAEFYRDYLFDVRPTNDDKPFFFQSFQWRHASRFWSLLRQRALPVSEWGYLVSLATVAQTFVLSVVLIGLPLVLLSRRHRVTNADSSRFSTFAFFAALGFGFMLLEMALLQRFVLFLAHPIYSASVVIASFLIFAGVGSATAWMRAPFAPLVGVIAVGSLELVFLPKLFGVALAAPGVVKIALVVLAIAPLAFLMGMPFPLALRRVSDRAPSLVPWAWGINGCCSVVAASLAPLLAIHVGFTGVIILSLACYLLAAVLPRSS